MIEFNATFLVAMISFVVFMFIMNAIFYRPILSIMRNREEYVSSNNSQAQNMHKKADGLVEEKEQAIIEAKNEGRIKLADSIEKDQNEALAQINNHRELFKQKIAQKKQKLLSEKDSVEALVNSNFVSDLSELITSKVMDRNI